MLGHIGEIAGAGAFAVAGVVAGVSQFGFNRITCSRKLTTDQCFELMEHLSMYSRADFDRLAKEDAEIVSRDGLKLRGYYIEPFPEERRVVIIVHGYTLAHPWAMPFVEMFTRERFNALVVDQRAHGRSEGKFTTYGFYEKFDIAGWVEWVRKRKGEDCLIGLHGTSLGGGTVLEFTRLNPNVGFIIADCPYSDLGELVRYQIRNIYKAPVYPFYPMIDLMLRCRARFRFADVRPITAVRDCGLPIMFVHGGADDFVPTWMSERMYEAKRKGMKKLLIVEGAAHGGAYGAGRQLYEREAREFVRAAIFGSATYASV
jgi:hypothetical protein